MRECMFNAGYLDNRQSENLEFTTERMLKTLKKYVVYLL